MNRVGANGRDNDLSHHGLRRTHKCRPVFNEYPPTTRQMQRARSQEARCQGVATEAACHSLHAVILLNIQRAWKLKIDQAGGLLWKDRLPKAAGCLPGLKRNIFGL